MQIATGVAAQINRDGTVTVKVSIVDDSDKATPSVIKVYNGKDLQAVIATLKLDLQIRKASEDEAVLSAAVVGQELARSV